MEGLQCIKSLQELRDPLHTSVSVITPPHVTETVLEQVIALGTMR
jgi:hypothetical protein